MLSTRGGYCTTRETCGRPWRTWSYPLRREGGCLLRSTTTREANQGAGEKLSGSTCRGPWAKALSLRFSSLTLSLGGWPWTFLRVETRWPAIPSTKDPGACRWFTIGSIGWVDILSKSQSRKKSSSSTEIEG